MKKFVIGAVSIILLGGGCFGTEPEAPTEEPEVTPVTTAPTTPPPTGDSGISNHALFFATSTDGQTWSYGANTVAAKASVPNLLLLNQAVGAYPVGTLMSHFVDATIEAVPGEEHVSFITSTDNGKTWSERTTIQITRLPTSLLTVDPSVVQLSDGRLRIYFYDFAARQGVRAEEVTALENNIYSAISSDGANFTFEGKVFARKNITDPEVAYFNGTWFMYTASVQEDKIVVATSTDGTSFAETDKLVDMKGIPGSLVVGDSIYLYGCDGQGITRASSTDGQNFSTPEVVLKVPACDPDPTQLSDGTFAMMIKGFSTTLQGPAK